MEMTIRAVALASSREHARGVRQTLLDFARQWGDSAVLPQFEPYEEPGMWKLGVRVRLPRATSPQLLLPDVLDTLGTGPWDSHMGDDIMANWATWDTRLGGSVVINGINWLHVQLVPGS